MNQTFNSYYLEMEIEEQEYKRLKSREEKLMAYYEWYVDKENDLATVEDIVNKNIKLEEENRKLKEEKEIRALNDRDNLIQIEKLEQENKKLKESLDIATKCSSKEEDGIIRLSEENKKLKAELEIYKKQYKHTIGGDYIDEDLYDLDC